jgi:hypothetical protein
MHSSNIKFIILESNLLEVNLQLNCSSVIFYASMSDSSYFITFKASSENDIKVLTYIKGSQDLLMESETSRSRIHKSEFVIFETKENIKLLTKEIFVNRSCLIDFTSSDNYLELNSFNTQYLKWDKELKFFEKNQNFHQCVLFFFTTVDQVKSFQLHATESQLIEDLFLDMINILSKAKNFTPVIMKSNADLINCPAINGSFLGANEFNTEFFSFFINLPLNDVIEQRSFTLPIENDEIFLMVTPGESYTYYEKLLLPFDVQTWKYLLLTFGCAFMLIFVINLMPRKIQDLVYGESVETPAYNVVGEV